MSDYEKDSVEKAAPISNVQQHTSEYEEKVEKAEQELSNKIHKEYKAAGYNKFFETCKEAEKNQKRAIEKARSLKKVFHTIVNSMLDKKRASGPGKKVTIRDNIIAEYNKKKNPELNLKSTLYLDYGILGCFNDEEKINEINKLFKDLTKVKEERPKEVKVPIDINDKYECFYKLKRNSWRKRCEWNLKSEDHRYITTDIPIKNSGNTLEMTVYTNSSIFTGELTKLTDMSHTRKPNRSTNFMAINTELIEAAEKINKKINQRLDKIEEIQSKWMNNYSTSIALNEL